MQRGNKAAAHRGLRVVWVVVGLLATSASSQAGDLKPAATDFRYKSVYTFDYAHGSCPRGVLAQLPDGFFYGTTLNGGSGEVPNGLIFKLNAHGEFTVLRELTDPDGVSPTSGVTVGSDGYLYGAAQSGGTSGAGTIFRVKPTGEFTVLHAFNFSGGAGYSPMAAPVQASDGNFYGATAFGGSGGGGIYRMTPTGQFTVLHTFQGAPKDGFSAYEVRLMQASDGKLYGTTIYGGKNNSGVIYRLSLDGTFELIHSFTETEGFPVEGALVEADGYLYGANFGGAFGRGTAYRISLDGKFKLLHTFDSSEGASPNSGLVRGADGNFYGTTWDGGTDGKGTVFRMTPKGAVTVLRNAGDFGAYRPSAGLALTPDGDFFGISCGDGSFSYGNVFRMRPK
jgi:uncharacterized repeat protein (TIGR03803 family)